MLVSQWSPLHQGAVLRWIATHRPARVWEWGAGGSTVLLSAFADSIGCLDQWTVVDTSARWVARVAAETGSKVRIVHRDYGLTDEDDGDHRAAGVAHPLPGYEAVDAAADLFIVDGHKRRRCLLEARKHLAPGGCIVLHDAQRVHYHAACEGLQIAQHRDGADELWMMTA